MQPCWCPHTMDLLPHLNVRDCSPRLQSLLALAQGLLANLYVETANGTFHTKLKKLSPHEILQNAELKKDGALFSSKAIVM